MSGEVKRGMDSVALFAVLALSLALATIGLASCGSAKVTVRSAGQQYQVSTSAAQAASTSLPTGSGGVTDGIDIDALRSKVAGYLADHPDASVTSAIAVRSDRSALLALTGDSDDTRAKGTPVIVLQLRGHFPTMVPTNSMQKQPDSDRLVPVPSAEPRTAMVITESMSLDLTQVYDVATQFSDGTSIDLSRLDAPLVAIPVDR